MGSPTPNNKISLLDRLPLELILHVLHQESIGPRECCQLEATSREVHALIDGAVWYNTFTHHHRKNALREPECCKQEIARRVAVSRTWREVGGSSSRPQASKSGRVRRISREMLGRLTRKSSSRAVVSPCNGGGVLSQTHVVDARSGASEGSFSTIGAALVHASAYDVIMVAPGVYTESLQLEKPIELCGMGPLGASRLVGVGGPAIAAASKGVVCRVARMSIEHRMAVANGGADAVSDGGEAVTGGGGEVVTGGGGEAVTGGGGEAVAAATTAAAAPRPTSRPCGMSAAVLVHGGARMVVEECTVVSHAGHCIALRDAGTCANIVLSAVQQGKGIGILVSHEATAVIRDNVIDANGGAGVALLRGADALVCSNRICDGSDAGVLVSEGGKGTVESNDIYGNKRAGVAILTEGAPLIRQNRIHDGQDCGVLICSDGKGVVAENQLFANSMAALVIGHGGMPSEVSGNDIRDGQKGCICLAAVHSQGRLEANVIHQRRHSEPVRLPEALLSDLAQRNQICYDDA